MSSKQKKSESLGELSWRRFKKDGIAMFGAVVISLAVIIAILGYLVMPDSTPNANEQILEYAIRKPGFNATVLKVKKNRLPESQNIFKTLLFGKPADYRPVPVHEYWFEKDQLFVEVFTGSTPNDGEVKHFELPQVAYALPHETEIVVQNGHYSFTDITGKDVTISKEEIKQNITQEQIEKRTYLLGTDRFGRDLLSRILAGTRISLAVGFVAVFISLVIGILLGSLAGFFRGWIDDVVMWFVTVVWSIPLLLLVIAITLAMGKGFWQVFLAVGLAMWVEVARIVRGQILSIREKEYVEACKALGFSEMRTVVRHILPNIMGPVIVISAANFAAAILIEAGLSFLGIGAQPPTPSWGAMIKDHYGYIILDEAYLAIVPACAIVLMVLAFTLVGNGIRDALDVRATA